MEEFSDQQQKIIKYVIKNSPYGELQEVIKDLAKLVDNFDVNNDYIQNLIREHNEEHLALIQDENSQYMTAPIFFQEGFYIDQKNKQKISIDHLNQTVASKEQIELNLNPTFEEYRQLIEQQLEKYISQYYKPDCSKYQTFIDFSEDDFTFYICLTSKNLNLKNFHGGEWISEWKIDQNGLQGKVRINTHYFEDGNVGLKDVKNIKHDFTFAGNKEEESKQLLQIIQQEESQIQNSLSEMYDNMNNLFFKNMRRLLPVTNQKMEWNLYAQKMRGNLSN